MKSFKDKLAFRAFFVSGTASFERRLDHITELNSITAISYDSWLACQYSGAVAIILGSRVGMQQQFGGGGLLSSPLSLFV